MRIYATAFNCIDVAMCESAVRSVNSLLVISSMKTLKTLGTFVQFFLSSNE